MEKMSESESPKVLWKSTLSKDFINKIQTNKESDVNVDIGDELYACNHPSKLQKLDVSIVVDDDVVLPMDELITKINETNSKYFQKSENEILKENRAEILSSILSNQNGSTANSTANTIINFNEFKPPVYPSSVASSSLSKAPSTIKDTSLKVSASISSRNDKFFYSGSGFGMTYSSPQLMSSVHEARVKSLHSIPCSPLSSWYLSNG